MHSFLQDLRYGIRMLLKHRGFAVVAVLTLSLGIGANTAIFTVLKAVLLSTLPVSRPEQLVLLTDPDSHGMSVGNSSGERDLLTYAEFQEIARHNQVLSGVLAADSETRRLPAATDPTGAQNEAAPAGVDMVSGSYFTLLGVSARVGRVFGAEVDSVRDANPVAVISYGFWQSRLGGDPGILHRQLRIRGATYDIVGVTPAGFTGITVGDAPDIWCRSPCSRKSIRVLTGFPRNGIPSRKPCGCRCSEGSSRASRWRRRTPASISLLNSTCKRKPAPVCRRAIARIF